MAKRYTDTEKYKKPFLRGLPGAYKLFWDYLYHSCDHAGIWIVDFEIAQIYLGQDMLVNKEDALKYFNQDEQRIVELNHGSKWFIPSFIEFQYGELHENNKVHYSILQIFKKYNVKYKGLARGLQSPMDKDKEKDKDKESFDKFWKLYNKSAAKEKCINLWYKIKPELYEIIYAHVINYVKATPDKQYRKNPDTYLRNQCWNDEIINSQQEIISNTKTISAKNINI